MTEENPQLDPTADEMLEWLSQYDIRCDVGDDGQLHWVTTQRRGAGSVDILRSAIAEAMQKQALKETNIH